MKSLGIDIGGSGIKGAVVETETGIFAGERFRVPTPAPSTPKAVAQALGRIVRHFEWSGPVGVGFPGPIKHGHAPMAANLARGWLEVRLNDIFADAAGCPVHVLNDADAAGLAEMRFGAGRGARGVTLVVVLGTGIGTALFLDSRLVPNIELGHVEFNGKDAEVRASARARLKRRMSWSRWAEHVDDYLGYLERLLWPDLIIVGGGVSRRHQKFLPRLTVRAPVLPAQLANNAGIVGAALAAAETGASSRRS